MMVHVLYRQAAKEAKCKEKIPGTFLKENASQSLP